MPVDRAQFEEGDERFSIENEILDFLHENQESAYDVHEVMDTWWSEANIESGDFEEFVSCFLNLATVSSILDGLVDDGRAKRRILDN